MIQSTSGDEHMTMPMLQKLTADFMLVPGWCDPCHVHAVFAAVNAGEAYVLVMPGC